MKEREREKVRACHQLLDAANEVACVDTELAAGDWIFEALLTLLCINFTVNTKPSHFTNHPPYRLYGPHHQRCLKSQSQTEMNCRRRIATASNYFALLQRFARKKAHKVNKNSHGIFYNDILRVVAPRLLRAVGARVSF